MKQGKNNVTKRNAREIICEEIVWSDKINNNQKINVGR